MKENEIRLIKDLYKHYDKNQTVDEDFLDSLSKDYGSIRGILMNVILKFDPNSNVSDDYIDSKLIEYKIEVDSQNNEQLTKEKEKVNDSNTPSVSNDNKTTSPNTSKKYLWLILIPTILILLFGIGYGIGFYGEDDEYSLDEADDALTPTLVESKDSNKMFNAVPDEYIDYSNKYIKLKRAYFYSYPNKESRLRSYVVMGDNIQYDPQSLVNGFYNSKFINANNGVTTSGWIHQDAIFPDQKTLIDGSSLTEKLPKKELVANINVDKLNLRSSPEISDNIIGMLMLDDRVVFIDSISIDLPKIENGTLNKNITIEHNGQDYAFNKNKVVKINGKEGVYQLDVNISLGDGRELSNVILPITDLNLEKKQVWAKIEQGNKTGYVYYRFLKFDGPESVNNFDHSASVSYIKINDPDGYTNVREGKSSSTKIIYQIYDENKLFELLDDSGNWWKIKLDSSETKTSTGFIYKSKVIRVLNPKNTKQFIVGSKELKIGDTINFEDSETYRWEQIDMSPHYVLYKTPDGWEVQIGISGERYLKIESIKSP